MRIRPPKLQKVVCRRPEPCLRWSRENCRQIGLDVCNGNHTDDSRRCGKPFTLVRITAVQQRQPVDLYQRTLTKVG